MRRTLLGSLLAGLLLAVSGCAPTHRLAEVTLEERSIAVAAPLPPDQRVVVSPWPFVEVPSPRAGGASERRFEAARAAQGRFDRAVRQVDVFERVASYMLTQSARDIGFHPQSDPTEATYLLDVRLLELRFLAPNFDAPVRLVAEADVALIDQRTEEVMWQRHIRTRTSPSPADLGIDFPEARLTPRTMTRLTTADFETVLEHAAAMAAWELASALAGDYQRARR